MTKNELTEKLLLTDRQLRVLCEALDLYDRLLMGQIENTLWNLFVRKKNGEIDHDKFSALCGELKQVVFTELDRNAFYCVGWKEDDARQQASQIAYEIEAMIRHERWKRNGGEPKYSTSGSPPLPYSSEAFVILERLAEPGEAELRKLHENHFPGLPILEMMKRGWIQIENPSEPEEILPELMKFFDCKTVEEFKQKLGYEGDLSDGSD